MAGLTHACRCGAVEIAVAVPSRRAGTRVTCYCADCQTAARLCPEPDALLGPAGGTDIWQTTPDRLTLVRGAEHLEIRRLSPKGLCRWTATCCETPLFNTLERLGFPFVGLTLRPDEAGAAAPVLGPVTAHAFTRFAKPGAGAPPKDVRFAATGAGLMLRALAATLTGRAGQTPLRRADGGPVAPVRIIDRAARDAARP
jgi:hypothetical protein